MAVHMRIITYLTRNNDDVDWIHAQALYKYNSSDYGVIRADSYKGRLVKVQHEEFNKMISNQGYESSGRSNRLEWKQR